MKINGYEVALSEADLDDKLNNQTVDVDLIKPDFPAYRQLSDGDKKAFAHLVKAARMFNDVFLEQDHKLDIELKEALEDKAASDAYAAKVLRFFNSLNGVEGLNGIDKEPVEIFKGVKGNPGRNFYPDDLSAEELQEILIKMLEEGKVNEVKKILSVRTMVRRHGDELKAIDFTEYFAREFSDIANEIELAAHYTTDEPLKDYLGWQAQALLQNNEDMDMLADKHWAVLQDTPIEFTIARENYNDELTSTVFDNPRLAALLKEHRIEVNAKDSIGVRVGLVNREGTDLILKFKNHMCELAKLMPYCERYEQNVSAGGELKQTMVDVDLAVVTGDFAAVRGGMTVAENLPNNDKLAIKTGGGRRNVYHRQVRQSADAARNAKLLDELVEPGLHRYFDVEAEHLFVIGHENGHSFGPDSSYQSALGAYKHIIEEHKADVISLAFMPEYVKMGVISEDMLKKVYLTHTVSGLFLKAEPNMSLPHRIADLIQFNYLLEHGTISFDDNGKLHLDFSKFSAVMLKLLEETIAVQLSKSPDEAKAFVERYAVWGEQSRRIAEIQNRLGLKPYKQIKTYF